MPDQNEQSGKRFTPVRGSLEGFRAISAGDDGTLKAKWNDYYPRPPSKKNLNPEDLVDETAEQVAVFNANTHEGSTMVKVLSEKGLRVVAGVRVYTSPITKTLIKLPGVTVKVADWSDERSLLKVAEGCTQAFVVTKYWERFDSKIEEAMATNILRACSRANPPIKHMVLATFENAKDLIVRKQQSQILPTEGGKIYPCFDGKKTIDKNAAKWNIGITHMMTSYLDDGEKNRKSLVLMRGDNGRIIVQPHLVGEILA